MFDSREVIFVDSQRKYKIFQYGNELLIQEEETGSGFFFPKWVLDELIASGTEQNRPK